MNIKVKIIVASGGYNVNANGTVNVTFIAEYSELTNIIKVQQLLNNDVKIKARIPNIDGKAEIFELGYFRVKQTIIDNDGESKLKFNGLAEQIEMDNLYKLPVNNSDVRMYNILLEAEV